MGRSRRTISGSTAVSVLSVKSCCRRGWRSRNPHNNRGCRAVRATGQARAQAAPGKALRPREEKSPAKRGCNHTGTSLFVFVRLSDDRRIVVLPILVAFFFDFGFVVFIVIRMSRRHLSPSSRYRGLLFVLAARSAWRSSARLSRLSCARTSSAICWRRGVGPPALSGAACLAFRVEAFFFLVRAILCLRCRSRQDKCG